MNFIEMLKGIINEDSFIDKAAAIDCQNFDKERLKIEIHNYGDSHAVDLMEVYDFNKIETDDLRYICFCFMTGRDMNLDLSYAMK